MYPLDELDRKIELLRSQLIELAMKQRSLTDETVVGLSVALDQYILEYQYRIQETKNAG